VIFRILIDPTNSSQSDTAQNVLSVTHSKQSSASIYLIYG